MNRLLITGAAGGLGTMCRTRLGHLAKEIRLSDMVPMDPASATEEVVICNLADKTAVADLVRDCDGILHLGGKSVEGDWTTIRSANIDGMVHLYEAARTHGVPRIVFASSNHVIGYHAQTHRLDTTAAPRPDSLYGVSKAFGEALASMYFDKFGIETACIRIGSCFEEPKDHRMLSTWISPDDFIRLITCLFAVPRLGCQIIYGVSDNDAAWWDNAAAGFIGWRPRDNAETFRARLDAALGPPDPNAVQARFQGGGFCSEGIHEG